jgi:DNA segregation ATPase FtsK/SpoIIIE, S-DNA-T family
MLKKFFTQSFSKKRKSTSALWKYREEIVGVGVAASFALLFFSLISYNPHDNSWFHFSSDSRVISNLTGVVGANVSALLVYLFGSASYFFIGCLLLLSIFLLRSLSVKEEWGRLVGLGMIILTSATIFRAHEIGSIVLYPGGVIGEWGYNISFGLLYHVGTVILMYSLFLVGTLMVARVSLYSFLQTTWSVTKAVSIFIGVWTYKIIKAVSIALWKSVAWIARTIKTYVQKRREQKKNKAVFNDFSGLAQHARKNDEKEKEQSVQATKEIQKNIDDVDLKKITAHELIYAEKFSWGQNFFFLRNTMLSRLLFKEKDGETDFDELLALISEAGREPVISYKLPDFKEIKDDREEGIDDRTLEALCKERAKTLEEKLLHFGIKGKVTAVRPGPVITLFEYEPEINMKVSKIVSLEDDLALALQALSIRIIAPIPGRNVVGFEIANKTRKDVFLSDILFQEKSAHEKKNLPIVFGVDITGTPVIEDLVHMPHLLVSGSTGSGKSVGLNTMLTSLLCNLSPEQLRLILVDPKRLEFAPYADVPHLLFPIVTSPRQAIPVLKWVVQEMEDRYETMSKTGVRSILEYHKLYSRHKIKNEVELQPMPFIVVMIDELADLMMVAGKEVEMHLARIAQMARAAGIHMIVATQRPSVDVLTGVIKVNFPSRLAFRVSSKIDSRTIIDMSGAEKLLGRGDMLFMDSGSSDVQRVHGAFVSDKEIKKLTDFARAQKLVEYLDINEALRKESTGLAQGLDDELYPEVVEFIKQIDEISISMLQRHYRIGFNRSARLIEKLETDGFIAPAQGSKPRKVLR